MKSRQEILEALGSKELRNETIDGRDFTRLAKFFPVSDWSTFGCELAQGAEEPMPEELAVENVKAHLARDLGHAFDKALDQRGISAALMNAVIKMWLWVLDDPLTDCNEYRRYGLPLLKKAAVEYELPNPIGDDYGDEDKYAYQY